jgi:hypothetical protein
MNIRTILIAAALFIAGPAFAQAPATGTPAHQPGVPGQPARPSTATPPSAKEGPAAAAPAAPPAAEKPDPAKDAAIRHLLEITHTSGEDVSAFITSQVSAAVGRGLAPDRLTPFMETFSKKFNASAPASGVTDTMIPFYARAFSLEDIEGLVKFYESPLGQRTLKTLPQVQQQSGQAAVQSEQQAAMTVLNSMTDQYPELKAMLAPPPQPGQGPAPGAAPAPAPKPAPQVSPAPKPSLAPPAK